MSEISASAIGSLRYAVGSAATVRAYNYNGVEGLTLAQLIMAFSFRRAAQTEQTCVNMMNQLSLGADRLTTLSDAAQFVLSNGQKKFGRWGKWSDVRAFLVKVGVDKAALPETIDDKTPHAKIMGAYEQVRIKLTKLVHQVLKQDSGQRGAAGIEGRLGYFHSILILQVIERKSGAGFHMFAFAAVAFAALQASTAVADRTLATANDALLLFPDITDNAAILFFGGSRNQHTVNQTTTDFDRADFSRVKTHCNGFFAADFHRDKVFFFGHVFVSVHLPGCFRQARRQNHEGPRDSQPKKGMTNQTGILLRKNIPRVNGSYFCVVMHPRLRSAALRAYDVLVVLGLLRALYINRERPG